MTTTSQSNKSEQLKCLEKKVKSCKQCEELANHRAKVVFDHRGNPDAELVFIGQAPGEVEDEKGVPFTGQAGDFLNDTILSEWMQLKREAVFVGNIICCYPPKKCGRDRKPSSEEAKNCRSFLDDMFAIIKPKFICCLGAVAAKALLGRDKTLKLLRGKVWDYKGIKVICTYHPTSSTTIDERLKDIKLLMKVMGRK